MSGQARRQRVPRLSVTMRFSLITLALVVSAAALALALGERLGDVWLAGGIAIAVMAPLALYVVHAGFAPMLAMFRALAGTVASFRDGDFSFSLRWKRNDELGDLVAAHNELSAALREERRELVQRELLLDTMLQNTPVAMLLCDSRGRIVYANIAARKLLHDGRRLEGQSLAALLEAGPAPLREAVERGGDGLFAVPRDEDEDDVYHLARRRFTLNGRQHELFLLRYLTVELRRQEVRTWKKVIRVISHELNNSLGPIGSLAHSGAELVRRGEHGRLEQIFAGIEERTRHLDGFIRGYASFAKLPAPRVEDVMWPGFVERLRSQVEFRTDEPVPDAPGRFDPGQLEQALLNLLRNAHESGSPPEDVRLKVRRLAGKFSIEVRDRGSGMSEGVLSNALLPFYSTKRGGTGLGLALVREIAEAHGGRVALANRDGGGLIATVVIPD
ncbi:MAG: PAS domain-containing protein [Gammaproteobacteria bacterium]|nr:PAS domain-containing protein [Gammaproteobacteria bacterium]